MNATIAATGGADALAFANGLDRDAAGLVAALRNGLPLVPEPFAPLAVAAGLDTASQAQAGIATLVADGTITRFGAILRHHELGYVANAMCVFDIPDAHVDRAGEAAAALPFVTLAYRRRRCLPHWPYNLFCMIHGRDRDVVRGQARHLADRIGACERRWEMLFSRRRFKQTAGRYGRAKAGEAP